jgi:3-methylcrotonyl-CoA carboxylase beta subunit
MAPDKPTPSPPTPLARAAHMRLLVEQLHKLEDRLRAGGGSKRIEKQHKAGKLTARERIAKLIDPGARFLEIGRDRATDPGESSLRRLTTALENISCRLRFD